MTVSDSAIEGISGALGGIIALTATYPLMTIATLQAVRQKKKTTGGSPAATAVLGDVSTTSQSKLQDFVQVCVGYATAIRLLSLASVQLCTESGWRGLYAGIEPALLGTAVSQGIYFYLYSSFRQIAVAAKSKGQPMGASRRQDIGIGPSLLIAALAGCGNVLLTNPIWVVATRMQASRKATEQREDDAPVRPVAVAREIYNDYGIGVCVGGTNMKTCQLPLSLQGFWKGVVPSLVMVANPTVQYVLYEAIMARRNAARKRARGGMWTVHCQTYCNLLAAVATKPSALEIFGVSAVAKLGATVVTYPLLLVKTRMQTVRKGSGTETQYASTLDAVLHVYNTEGLLGFYRGMHTKMVQSVVAAALLFLIKEEVTEATAKVLRGPPRHVV